MQEDHLKIINLTAQGLDPMISKFTEFDIETQNIVDGFPPIPKDIKVAFCCEYLQEVYLDNSKTISVIVLVKYLYVDDKVISDRDDISFKLDAISRVGRSYKNLV